MSRLLLCLHTFTGVRDAGACGFTCLVLENVGLRPGVCNLLGFCGVIVTIFDCWVPYLTCPGFDLCSFALTLKDKFTKNGKIQALSTHPNPSGESGEVSCQ